VDNQCRWSASSVSGRYHGGLDSMPRGGRRPDRRLEAWRRLLDPMVGGGTKIRTVCSDDFMLVIAVRLFGTRRIDRI